VVESKNPLMRWLRHHIPTRERIEQIRWLRPVAHIVLDPPLWRFTRRSVPRGVALGMSTGILVPPLHFPASAVLAFPLRANIPSAAATAVLVNPVTAGVYWYLGYKLGHWLLGSNRHVAAEASAAGVPHSWLHWLFNIVGPATLTGILIVTVACAALGYLLAALGWRWWIVRKWRARAARRTSVLAA